MSPRVYFPKAAEDEYLEAEERYTEESETLGAAFRAEVERGAAFLEQFPEGAPVVSGAVRRLVLRRFPFSLFYVIEKERIRILAVAHHKREPGYWRGRLKPASG